MVDSSPQAQSPFAVSVAFGRDAAMLPVVPAILSICFALVRWRRWLGKLDAVAPPETA